MKFKTLTLQFDLETGEVITPYDRIHNYYVVEHTKETWQPDKQKALIIIRHTYKCRKLPNQLKLL